MSTLSIAGHRNPGLPRPSVQSRADHLLLEVDGMKCASCVSAVEGRLAKQSGVAKAEVNLLTRTAAVDLDPASPADPDQLVAALQGMGFPARLRGHQAPEAGLSSLQGRRNWWSRWRRLMVALVLLVISGWAHLAAVQGWELPLLRSMLFHAVVATVAMAVPGRDILTGGWRALMHRLPTMDSLIALGITAAYGSSLVALVFPAIGWQCFFQESVMLLGFVILGRFLEERARCRAGLALQQLAALQPDTARVLVGSAASAAEPERLLACDDRPIRTAALRKGDRLRLLPGDRNPVDGTVLAGCSSLDMASLTGEPLPVEAGVGDVLAAGALNLTGPLIVAVEHGGAETSLARMIRLVEEAQGRKAPIQRVADRVAGRFCYGVLGLALATFLFWWLWGARLWPQVLATHDLHAAMGHGAALAAAQTSTTPLALATQLAIAVLVVACPCALGLATPVAITVGTGRGARCGLLFRGGDVMETAAHLDMVVLDKTGTLTIGRPLVCEVLVSPVWQRSRPDANATLLLQLAASLEQQTQHPLAHALLQEAQNRQIPLLAVTHSQTEPGLGVRGVVAGQALCLGRPEWMEEQQLLFPDALKMSLARLNAEGLALIAVASESQVLGLLAVDDPLRSDAAQTVQRLRSMGLALRLLSGDRRAAAVRLAGKVGLHPEEVIADTRPEGKGKAIEALRAEGRAVAMVGDGINDALALARADLGVAVGTGTQIAQDAANLVVSGEGLGGVVDALILARATLSKVRQNLFWAFSYNGLALPTAMGAFLPLFGWVLMPSLAALLMAISSITVVINALLLRWHTDPRATGADSLSPGNTTMAAR